MKQITIGNTVITEEGPAYFIAEIGHNHQGNLEKAEEMIVVAAKCGVQAVKLQKRDNRSLYTKAFYDRPYDNENSYGATYGEHREFLEFGAGQYAHLKRLANQHGVEFLATAFDQPSADFLEDIGVNVYKIASGDLTNTPLLAYIAKLGKPMIVSTGASTLREVRRAHDTVRQYNDQLVFLHCVARYPAEYADLNLRRISLLQREFPDVLVGYSDHHPGIEPVGFARMLGAVVFEKHFTLNRGWKGTDHGFSLEPTGLQKQIELLQHIPIALGREDVEMQSFESDPRRKMGKSLYTARPLKAGHILTMADIVLKTPADGLPPYCLEEIIGQTLVTDLNEETLIRPESLVKVSVPTG